MKPAVLSRMAPRVAIKGHRVFKPMAYVGQMGSCRRNVTIVGTGPFTGNSYVFARDKCCDHGFTVRASNNVMKVGMNVPIPATCFPFSKGGSSFFNSLRILKGSNCHFFAETGAIAAR